jgi:hypothetical protein
MAKTITLKYAAKCADPGCGAELAVGDKAKWYGRGKVYGLNCHEKKAKGGSWIMTGANGQEYYQNRSGRCEDAPCCGCCNC